MTRRASMRRRALGVCLVASLALTVWTWRRQGEAVSGAVVRQPAAQADAAGGEATAPSSLLGTGGNAATAHEADAMPPPDALADPFAVTNWEPPPPPPPPVQQPPPPPAPVAPSAPPLPFRYVGRQELAQGPASATEYYLAREGEAIAVRAGARIGEDYRFEGEAAPGTLRFIYLPLGTQQTLFIGEEK